MNPTKILADQTEAVLRLFGDIDRGEADRLLAMYSPWLRMRELSVDAAEELRELVLGRFSAAEPPSVPGLDFLPAAVADAALVVASLDVPAPEKVLPSREDDDPLGNNEPFCQACGHRVRMHSKDWGCNVWRGGKACPCVSGLAGVVPLVEVQP